MGPFLTFFFRLCLQREHFHPSEEEGAESRVENVFPSVVKFNIVSIAAGVQFSEWVPNPVAIPAVHRVMIVALEVALDEDDGPDDALN